MKNNNSGYQVRLPNAKPNPKQQQHEYYMQ